MTRRRLVGGAIALSAVIDALLMLPLVPVATLHVTPVVAVNYDAGETVGWPTFAATLAGARDALPRAERERAVILTENYGEAGAVDRYGPALGLPGAYSGHNAYGEWGPPPERQGPVLAVGIPHALLHRLFGSVRPVARIDNSVDVDNDEQGATVWLCRGRRETWRAAWPLIRHLS